MVRKSAHVVTVLQSFPRPRPTTNPYITQLVGAMPDDVRVLTFTWRHALFAHYDVLHLHWPELMLRAQDRRRTAARLVLGLLLVLRLAALRVTVVRTTHNRRPHEPRSRFERVLLRALDRLTVRRIALNADGREHPDTTLIRHGHYRDWFDTTGLPRPDPDHIAFTGLIRRYKNADLLIRAFRGCGRGRLTVAGQLVEPHLQGVLEAAADRDATVDLVLRYIDDRELVEIIGSASFVVLPDDDLTNSGALLLALSLGRPALVPSTPATEALAREVGERWVVRYGGDLDTETLTRVMDLPLPPGRPDLSARDWGCAGAAHREVYLEALAAGRARNRRRRISSAARESVPCQPVHTDDVVADRAHQEHDEQVGRARGQDGARR